MFAMKFNAIFYNSQELFIYMQEDEKFAKV